MFLRGIRNYILLISLCVSSTSLFGGLPEGTLIATATGLARIEHLNENSLIVSYDPLTNSYPLLPVKGITKYTADTTVSIKTDKGTLFSSADQIFYDQKSSRFINAAELNNQHCLLTQGLGECLCLSTTTENRTLNFYELTLAEPHLFFTSEARILTHNMASTAAAVALRALETIARAGCAIACVYIDKQPQILNSLAATQKQIQRDVEAFCGQYLNGNKTLFNPLAFKQNRTGNPHVIGGVLPDANLYNHILMYPRQFGPMYLMGRMTARGEIECFLCVLKFEGWEVEGKNNIATFDWKVLGNAKLLRNDPLVKTFIVEEDKKQLDTLRTLVKSWPKNMTAKLNDEEAQKIASILSYSMVLTGTNKQNYDPATPIVPKGTKDPHVWLRCADQIIYGFRFTRHAIIRSVERGIPPSVIAEAIHQYLKTAIRDPKVKEYLQVYDPVNKIRIIFDKAHNTVVTFFVNGKMP